METKTGTYNSDGEKWCGKGKHYCHVSDFGRYKGSKDGLNWLCLICRRGVAVLSDEEKQLREDQKMREQKVRILGQVNSASVVPYISWELLLKTKLVSKPNYSNQYYYGKSIQVKGFFEN